ncbi:hypothetical protein RJT34_13146 [Clitoria ternatea]|uniref:Uncharacterized protein n=1 Tax=Clitoria ternatea TaxID=43366 RepID=A0AAN9JQ25_CLITE
MKTDCAQKEHVKPTSSHERKTTLSNSHSINCVSFFFSIASNIPIKRLVSESEVKHKTRTNQNLLFYFPVLCYFSLRIQIQPQ